MGERPTRIAILGAGPAAMAAAFELTATPELRQRYAVTVHQLGWRLGGKGASGRNAAHGQRIEEHGLHIWFGFYNNAFALIRRCYEELGRDADAPLATWTEAFEPRDDCVQFERFEGEWVAHHFNLPGNPLVPGDGVEFRFWDVAHRALAFLESEWDRLTGHEHPHARQLLETGRRLAEHHTGGRGEDHARAPLDQRIAAHLLSAARDWAWKHVVAERVADKGLRMFFMWLDLAAAMFQGIVEDDLRERGFGAVNGEEFRAWLRRHGASELTLEGSPLVRAIYDAAFCYEEGDIARPNVAAGKAAQDFIRSVFLYKGALLYKMNAGMGDTIFSPLYEVLRRRGVRFNFFQCVTGLRVASDGAAIGAIDLVRQARVRNDAEYMPLVDVEGLPCWPSEPLWDQLEDGARLREEGVDFECDPQDATGEPLSLRRGKDFDAVVLGIPVGALGSICGELASANQRFAAMLEHSHSVMTQAFQLWLTKDSAELGWPYRAGTLASCYVEPMDTYCDMSHLIPREDWPSDEVKHVAYFCGVLPHHGIENGAQAQARVRENALAFLLEDAARLWPAAAQGGFDWSLLAGAGGATGEAAFHSQYWRANFTGSERYALTLAGSVAYRLWPDGSGFDNLVLAGDWTRNGIDGGSVEAAVTSGLLAARAISGYPKVVKGTAGWLESDLGDHAGD